jgi:hypothetical protein
MFEEGLIDIEELDEDLQAELLEVHFKTTSTGQTQIEAKEDIAQRLGRSPDRADAFVMSLQMQASMPTSNKDPMPHKPRPTDSYIEKQPSEPDDLVSDLSDMEF